MQPRFRVNGDAQSAPNAINTQAFAVPGIGDIGPYSRFYLRNPGFQNHDLSLFKNFPFGASGKRYLQFRLEAFNVLNHPQFSGVNRTTNVTNAAGQTGAAIFNNYTGLTVTNNTRPAGNTPVLGDVLRRVQRHARPAHHPARGQAVLLMGDVSRSARERGNGAATLRAVPR